MKNTNKSEKPKTKAVKLSPKVPNATLSASVSHALPGELVVRLKKSDPQAKLKEGDILLVKVYWLDPSSKYTIIRRLSDGFDPRRNVYRNEVDVIK